MNRPVLWRLVLGVAVLTGGCALIVQTLAGGWFRDGSAGGLRTDGQAVENARPGPPEDDPAVTVLEVEGDDGVVVSYVLAGSVVDARTGDPVAGVRVEVRGGGREWTEVATTDPEGAFATVVDGTGLFPPGRSPSGAGPAVDVRLGGPGLGTRTIRDWPLPAGGSGQPPVRLDGRDHDDPAHDLGLRRVG